MKRAIVTRSTTRVEGIAGPRRFAPVLALVVAAAAMGCGFDTMQGKTMGTTYVAKARCPGALPEAELAAAIADVEAWASNWREDSDLSRFNRAPVGYWVEVPEAFVRLVEVARGVSERTGGSFDITVGARVRAWGFGPPAVDGARPSGVVDDWTQIAEGNFAQALPEPAFHKMNGSYRDLAVRRQPPFLMRRSNVQVDLSGIAKGHAVDAAIDVLKTRGCTSGLVEIGGEVRVYGSAPGGGAWRIGIEDPETATQPAGQPATQAVGLVLWLREGAIATSGDYRQRRKVDGRTVGHIIDPGTGSPVETNLASVTVLHAEAAIADALATGLYAMGDAAANFASRHDIAASLYFRAPGGTSGESKGRVGWRHSPAMQSALKDNGASRTAHSL